MKAWVGVADHAGWAVLITAGPRGQLLDRRRVELLAPGLPNLPHHHDAQHLPLAEGVALVEKVRRSAAEQSRAVLATLADDLDAELVGLVLRRCPPLPATVAERIRSYAAQTKADTVMFREELARAAEARGWAVRWYDARDVEVDADFTPGPPWTKDHRVAFGAAFAAFASAGPKRRAR